MNRGVHISRESGYTQAEIIALIRGELEKQNDKNFPIGYIWMSTVDTDPSTIVGGTWERIQDTFLLAAGTNHSAGSTGGAETVTLTLNQMPTHRHRVAVRGYTADTSDDAITNASFNYSAGGQVGWAGTINEPTGGGGAHDNMPPYLAVYMWKRTG